MTSSDQNVPKNPRLEEALKLVSERRDGRLSAADESRLKALEAIFPDETAAFRRRCGQLGSALRALPVKSVGRSLVAASRLDEAEIPAQTVRGRNRGSSWRKSSLVSVSAVVVTCGLMFGLLQLAKMRSDTITDTVAYGVEPADATADAARALEIPAESRESATSAVALTTDAVDAVRPLLQTEHWNIVVLKVSSKDRAKAMEQIQAFVISHGLSVPGLENESRHDTSAWLGVVLTSAPDSNRKFVDDAILQGVVESADWDPRRIAEASREELIDAVRRSLQFPTKSELYHGQVYLEVPREQPSVGIARTDAPQADAAEGGLAGVTMPATPQELSDPALATDDSPDTLQAEPMRSKSTSAVTLVVFQFQPDVVPAGIDESDGRI